MGKIHRIENCIRDLSQFQKTIKDTAFDTFVAKYYQLVSDINSLSLSVPEHRPRLMKFCFDLCGAELEKSELCRHTRIKPYGYAGDFQIIDWILTNRMESNGVGRRWDEVYQRSSASRAVRNRAQQFCELVVGAANDRNAISVLNLACGPCRDVQRIYQQFEGSNGLNFICVDRDPNAIEYAQSILSNNREVKFRLANVLRFSEQRRYAVVWAGGLFDYLSDRQAIILLKRMWKLTGPGGTLGFANFLPSNSSTCIMEWCLDWFLVYRSEDSLMRLISQASIPGECVNYVEDHSTSLGYCICRRP